MALPAPQPAFGPSEFVEAFGVALEELGLPRMAGRILGVLLIAEPAEQSAAQLAEALVASAGSISGSTRMLLQLGIIERCHLPGDRRAYFRLRERVWWNLLRERMRSIDRICLLAERGLSSAAAPGPRHRLEELTDFYGFLDSFLEEAITRWETRKEASPT